ncbi:MAG TPA: asparagine synthase (glutamine-hydrolyzing) [Chitinophagaceae bacterium]|jgi:asparagine synthase (glutamine-hydrolysing)|nr:asparagine synthase (glutamine-hydrolyzing) [Chitinophagaceae bacterium]
MCGITGFIDFRKRSSEEVLKKMTATLAHRGPDGEGFLYSESDFAQAGLGHRRLSIIDLSAVAGQPMTYKQLHIVFNGEIFNYEEIRNELLAKGHSFVTKSDTEVILHAYEEWGLNAVDRFIGMFAFVIYDEGKQQLIAFRDRSGVKPFFYYWQNGLFMFGSELKPFHQHSGFERKINIDAVAAFLQHGHVPAPHCIFDNTFKLHAAHYLVLDIEKQTLVTHQYWNVYDLYNRPKLKIDLPEALEETEKVLKKAFEYRMVSDVPVGVFLSGGYDSSCVTALLQEGRTEKIKTFTIGMDDTKFDESPYAKKVAQHLGTDHTEYHCTDDDAKSIIPSLSYYYDEPFADSSAIPTMLVSRLAREKVTVALSADAGDELFAGYIKYEIHLQHRAKLSKLPKGLSKAGHYMMKAVPVHAMPFVKNNHLFVNRYDRFAEMLKNPTFNMIYGLSGELFTKREIDNIFMNQIQKLETNYRVDKLKPEYYDPLTYMMAVDYETYMVDDILQKVDRASMSVGLEGREPFLDQHIMDWVSLLPVGLKYHNGEKKYILKQLVHKYIPKEIMERPKMGFAIPINTWMKTSFKELIYTYLNDDFITRQGIFDKKSISRIVQGFYNGNHASPEKLWYLLIFQLWYKEWIHG